MKHRILSLVLALVLVGAVLTGCAYNIERDDLSQYASFDLTAFQSKLQEIEIKDSKTYSVAVGDEADAYRDQKLLEAIEDALKGAVDTNDTDAKKTEGVFADRQLLSYCYYITAEDGKVYYASGMKIASPSKLLIGSVKDDELVNAIAKALKDSGKDLKDCVYTSKSASTETAEGGKLAFVTYTREYTLSDNSVKKETMTLQPILLPAEKDDTTFAGKLVGEKLATSLFADGVTVSETVKDGENDVTVDVKYSSAKIEFVAQSSAAADVEYTYTEAKSMTDTAGKTNSVKDTKLTYHIFPVYYYEVAELSAKTVLTEIYGESLSTSLLPLFTEKDDNDKYVYKYTDDKGEEVTLYSLIKDITDKKSAVSSASGTDDKKTKQEALDKALEELWDEVVKCGEDMETKIVDEYKEKLTDNLKDTYEGDILDKVAAKVWALIDSTVTLSSYPEKAVKEAKEAIFENLKYTYYTGTETVNSEKKNLRDLYANVKEYIRQKSDYKADTYEASEALMQKEAEKQVGELVKVYVVAQAMGLSTTVNKTDMESFAQNMAAKMFGYDSYEDTPEGSRSSVDYFAQYYLSSYDESTFRRAVVFDRLMDQIMETGEGKLDFKNLHYAFEAEKTDDAEADKSDK